MLRPPVGTLLKRRMQHSSEFNMHMFFLAREMVFPASPELAVVPTE